jgi:hypothetical protein
MWGKRRQLEKAFAEVRKYSKARPLGSMYNNVETGKHCVGAV